MCFAKNLKKVIIAGTGINNDLSKKIRTLDLIAAEVKYHSSCFAINWKIYENSVSRLEGTSKLYLNVSDIMMILGLK